MNLFAMKRGLDEIKREGRNTLAELLKDDPEKLAYYLALVDQKHRQSLKDAAAISHRYERELEDAIVDGMVEIHERMKGQPDEDIAAAVSDFLDSVRRVG